MADLSKAIKGYKSLEYAPSPTTGATVTGWKAVDATVKGSTNFKKDNDTTKEFYIEQQADPYDSVVTQAGKKTLHMELYDCSKATSTALADGQVYAFRVTSKNNRVLTILKGRIRRSDDIQFQDEELSKLVIDVDVLAPNDAAQQPYTIDDATA